MDIIRELWYGNVSPFEQCTRGDKQMMNRCRYQLEDIGVFFESKRSNGQKYVVVKYRPPSDGDPSASSDSTSSVCDNSVSSVPCVPENVEEECEDEE